MLIIRQQVDQIDQYIANASNVEYKLPQQKLGKVFFRLPSILKSAEAFPLNKVFRSLKNVIWMN